MTVSSAAVACASALRPASSRAQATAPRARSVVACHSPGVIRFAFASVGWAGRLDPRVRVPQLKGNVTHLTHYLVKLAEREIDVGGCLRASTRVHVLQRDARQERSRYRAVQYGKAPGNADTVVRAALGPASAGRHAPSRVIFRWRHSRVHAPALLPSSHSTRANPLRERGDPCPSTGSPARAQVAGGGGMLQRYVDSLSGGHPQTDRSHAPANRGRGVCAAPEITDRRRSRGALAGLRVSRSPRRVPGAGGDDDGLELAVRPELHQDVLDVPAGGVAAHHEPPGNGLRI